MIVFPSPAAEHAAVAVADAGGNVPWQDCSLHLISSKSHSSVLRDLAGKRLRIAGEPVLYVTCSAAQIVLL